MAAALAELSPVDREVLLLYAWAELGGEPPMDEISAVKLFRRQIPARDEPARAAARSVLEDRLAPAARRRVLRSQDTWVALAAALVGVVAVSSALGWPHRLLDFVVGQPAPPNVKRAFTVHNEARARQVMIFRGSGANDVLVERAHGAIGIDSSVGPVIIWAVPTRGGGVCYVFDIEASRLPDGRPNGGVGCSSHSDPPSFVLEHTISLRRVGQMSSS